MNALSKWLVLLIASLLAPVVSVAASPVVVELFTSQGCSSCPPADALLGEVARRPGVIALAYHVDYWDDQGWKDRYSLAESGQRQRGYAKRLSRAGVFTPHAVVSGDTSFLGSDRNAMEKALAEKRDSLAMSVSRQANTLRIQFSEPWREAMDVYVVSYLGEATTNVSRGENAKRQLKEFNIVRSVKLLGRWNGKPQQMSMSLASLPRDATAVAVLLQRRGQGAIAAAATLTLQ